MTKQQRDALRRLLEVVDRDDLIELGLTLNEANAIVALYTDPQLWNDQSATP